VTREVILYTRRLCGLGDETADVLRRMSDELRFDLTEMDIDDDVALRERYNEIVPVVAVAGRVIASAPVDPRDLRARLAAALA
jgi:hypothetical protein